VYADNFAVNCSQERAIETYYLRLGYASQSHARSHAIPICRWRNRCPFDIAVSAAAAPAAGKAVSGISAAIRAASDSTHDNTRPTCGSAHSSTDATQARAGQLR
jgi:hypothetical protein